jgi:hypothetical protein
VSCNGLKHNIEEKLARSMIEEATVMVQSLVGKYSGTGSVDAAEPEETNEEAVDTAEGRRSGTWGTG